MSVKNQTIQIRDILDRDELAVTISNQFTEWENYRNAWLTSTAEVRAYVFSTDTSHLGSSLVNWKNSTHIPKICQIRDNLHANYMAALFPNDRFVKWEGDDRTSETKKKRQAIESYINNKMSSGDFIPEIEKCIYDWIDYGNAFAIVEYEDVKIEDEYTEREIQGFRGPKVRRLSPLDVVFNPTASDFVRTPKIVRSIMTLGALQKEIEDNPEKGYLKDVFTKMLKGRKQYNTVSQGDASKIQDYQIAGFSSFTSYMQSQQVEVLDFYGDIYDIESQELLTNQLITVIDRSYVLRKETNPAWDGVAPIYHVGWRVRQDNLYAMGPLENLVGMQYRIDHLENAKADGFDLIIHPVIKIKGYVEDFEYGPNERIFVGDEGDVEFMRPDGTILTADTQIAMYEQKMEEMAGAPKQALGFRTPGEKTAFEVQILENGANKVFLNKTSYFERVFLEKILNGMLQVGRRLMPSVEMVRQNSDDFNLVKFATIKRDDITAKGKIRPVGARHFARNANLMQNIVQLMNTPAMADENIRAHISGKKIAKLFEELLDLERFDLVRDNIMVEEQLETQQMVASAQQMLADQNPALTEGADPNGPQVAGGPQNGEGPRRN